jgi:hypothetical protein
MTDTTQVPEQAPHALPIPRPGLLRRTLRRVFGGHPLTVARRSLAMLAVFAVLWWGVLGNLMHRIDASPDFMPPRPVEGGSHAVNMAAALVEREVDTYRWSVNDPWFFPTAFLDNMPNFQQGMMRAISRFSIEMMDKVGRTRGTGAIDGDLERAVGLLQFPGDVWFLDLEKSWVPVVPAEVQYRAAVRALNAYNARVATGSAVFERRPDTLALTLSRLGADLNSRAALLDRHVQESRRTIDFGSDDVFYFNKGMLHAYYRLLSELGRDFEAVTSSPGLASVWNEAMESLRKASQLEPLVVLNAPGDDSIFANHLFLQGFYMKRAIMQLDEVVRTIAVRS